MNTISALKTSSTYGGPAIFGAGLAMFAVALAAPGDTHSIAAPRPTVTVTATRQPIAGPTTITAPSRPAASPTSVRAAEPSEIAAGRQPGGSAAAQPRPGAGAGSPSGPSPAPTLTVQPAGCDGSVLAVQVLHTACVSVGGSK